MIPDAGAHLAGEIELKYVVRRADVAGYLVPGVLPCQEIDQVYLDLDTVAQFAAPLGLDAPGDFAEWRLRRIDDRHYFTAKSGPGLARRQFEVTVTGARYTEMLAHAANAGPLERVRKTRYRIAARSGPLCAELDDYHETGAGVARPDFLTCEVEFPDAAAATRFRAAAPPEEWAFLAGALDVTGIPFFCNRALARQGFPADDFAALARRLEVPSRSAPHRV